MAVTGRGDAPLATVWTAAFPRTFNQGQALTLIRQDGDVGSATALTMNDYFFNAAAAGGDAVPVCWESYRRRRT